MSREKEQIRYLSTDEGQIPMTIIRTRRKSYGIVVDEKANVQLRIPLRGSEKKALEMAEEQKDWILSKISLQQKRAGEREQIQKEAAERFTDAQRRKLEKQYRKAAKELIPKRAGYYAQILGVTFQRIRITETKTRWGSCSPRGTLSFHWKLLLAPEGVLDYVIVHEVCHLKEINHSEKFWAWVAFLMPDYKEKKKWLQENGELLQYY